MIVVAATFVAEPLGSPLGWLLQEAGLEDEICFAPYHQVFQQLLTSTSELARSAGGIGVLVVRMEDFVRDLADEAVARQTIRRVSQDLAGALEKFAVDIKGTVLLVVLPPSPRAQPELAADLVEAGASLVWRARRMNGIQALGAAQVEEILASGHYDSVRDELAHIPYTEACFAGLALILARRIRAIRVPPSKVLILDCDNTLWRGVVGEDGVDGIEISEAHLALQDFAVAQQENGVLICLASKNAESDVFEVLTRRSEMHLKATHLVAHRINWQPKPENIRSLAAELDLGLDSFVFIDDSPIECAQMRKAIPEVVTIQLPSENHIPAFLKRLWMFDKLTGTAEDAARTRMYKENSARRAMETSVGDLDKFLALLNVKIDIAVPSTEDEWTRIEQLTQRTNQFNFTTRRRTAVALQSSVADGAHVLRVRVSDRFGDYGLVGVIVAQHAGTTLLVDNLMLSCRVLGRGVEHAMLKELGKLAQTLGLQDVSLLYIATARNVPARAFADSVASEFAQAAAEGTIYKIPAPRAADTVHRHGHYPLEVKGSSSPPPGPAERSELYSRFAHVLISGRAVVEQMAHRARRRRAAPTAATAPASALEAELLQLWEEVLQMAGLGVEDDFFALGGTSLLSVELFAQIARRFRVQLPLTAILDAPTVRRLAPQIAPPTVRERSSLVCLRQGGPRHLFLVHDGLGETLLYLNLANRLPATIGVYGIEPKRLPGIPLAHTSIEEMATFYVEQIREVQPQGPYLLGGMCAGGVIAYEMAACLMRAGERVQMVAILDGAAPQAARRAGVASRNRLSRFLEAITQTLTAGARPLARVIAVTDVVARKVYNTVLYEIFAWVERISVRMRLPLLKMLVERGKSWPRWLPELSVTQIYNSLESQYTSPTLADVPILLVRASAGGGLDTPYRDLYCDEDLGWRNVAGQLELVDVTGGHSSMLQEDTIDSLAAELMMRFPAPEPVASELSE